MTRSSATSGLLGLGLPIRDLGVVADAAVATPDGAP